MTNFNENLQNNFRYVKILIVVVWLDGCEAVGRFFRLSVLFFVFSKFSIMDLRVMSQKHQFKTNSHDNHILQISIYYVNTSKVGTTQSWSVIGSKFRKGAISFKMLVLKIDIEKCHLKFLE